MKNYLTYHSRRAGKGVMAIHIVDPFINYLRALHHLMERTENMESSYKFVIPLLGFMEERD